MVPLSIKNKTCPYFNIHSNRSNEAVSEAIGFIIIFGIMITGIGIVTLYGYPELLKQQHNAEIYNMERAFLVLQSDVNSLVYKNVPYRETNIQIMGGTLYVIPYTERHQYFTITIPTGSSPLNFGSPESPETRFYPGELRFNSSDQQFTISLENGAINTLWGSQGSTVLSTPRWFLDSSTKTLVISLVRISKDLKCPSSRADGPSRIEMNISNLKICDPDPGGSCSADGSIYDNHEVNEDVIVTYVSANPEVNYNTAWNNTLWEKLNVTPVMTGTTVTYTIPDVKRLIIRGYNITFFNI